MIQTFACKGKGQPRSYVFLIKILGSMTRWRAGRSGNRTPAGAINLSLLQNVQTGPWTYPASDLMRNEVSFPGGKAARAWCWTLTFITVPRLRVIRPISPFLLCAFMAFIRTNSCIFSAVLKLKLHWHVYESRQPLFLISVISPVWIFVVFHCPPLKFQDTSPFLYGL
jgi:hypothetical protein